MSQHFSVMETNPNEPVGKGCLCSEAGTLDSKGPFIVFNHTEMDTVRSPFPVLCAGCALAAVKRLPAGCEPTKPETQSTVAPRRKRPTDDIPEV